MDHHVNAETIAIRNGEHRGLVGVIRAIFTIALGDGQVGDSMLVIESDDIESRNKFALIVLVRFNPDIQSLGNRSHRSITIDVNGALGDHLTVLTGAVLGDSQLLAGALLQIAHLIGVAVPGVVQLQLQTAGGQLAAGDGSPHRAVIGKAGDGHGFCGVGGADIAHGLRGGVFRPGGVALGVLGQILGVMGDLVVGVGGIRRIVEDDLVDRTFLGGDHQTLLVGVGQHAADGDEGLRDHGLAVVGDGLFGCNGFAGRLIQVLDGVGHGLLLDVPEGERVGVVLLGGVDVQRQGVALGDGEIALLIAGVQLGAALSLEGLGNARQGGAGGGGRDLGIGALKLVVDGVRLQDVGAPFAVDLHILGDRHIGEVKGFLHAVFHVEPANEGIAAVGGIIWSGVCLGAVGNGDFRMRAQLGAGVQSGLVKIELHPVAHRRPLGVKQDVVRRHGMRIQLVFRAGALGVQIPAAEGDGAGLIGAGHLGNIAAVGAQRCLILDGFFLDIDIAIVEGQVVAVTGVVESCTCAGATITCTMMIGEALKLVAVFVGYSKSADVGDFKELDGIFSIQILTPIGHGTLSAGSTLVIIGCTGLGHDAEIVGIGVATAGLSRPEGAFCILGDLLILPGNVRAPLGGDGLCGLISIIPIVVFKGQGLFRAFIIHIHHAGAIGGHGNGVGPDKLPQSRARRAVRMLSQSAAIARVGMGMLTIKTNTFLIVFVAPPVGSAIPLITNVQIIVGGSTTKPASCSIGVYSVPIICQTCCGLCCYSKTIPCRVTIKGVYMGTVKLTFTGTMTVLSKRASQRRAIIRVTRAGCCIYLH